MKRLVWFSFMLCLSGAFQANATESAEPNEVPDWSTAIEKQGYQIATAEKSGSEFLQVKAEVVVNQPWQKVAKEFASDGKCWRWQNRCKKVELSAELDRLYSLIDMPWPLSDRDFLFTLSMELDEDAQYLALNFSPDRETQKKTKYTRGESKIRYVIKRQSDASTLVTIYMHTDFGGDVSPSLINGKLVDSLEEDIESLIKRTNDN